MSWKTQLRGDSLTWLLESDLPTVRHLALRDLLHLPDDDPQVCAARQAAHREGIIPEILEHMNPEGYWEKPGAGYGPKYRSTVWALLLLAQSGASVHEDERIPRACAYLLEHALAAGGQLSYNGAPSGTVDCLQGNLLYALMELGYDDPRLERAFDWLARSQTGEGIAPATERNAPLRYYAYKCGPDFACGANNHQGCAWGAVKVLLALNRCPLKYRTPLVEQAVQHAVDFLFSVDPASALYPTGEPNHAPSQDWWKFGFPVFYITDLLQLAEALAEAGYGTDPRLARSLDIIREKQDADGRWPLEYHYAGKTWGSYGPLKKPNPWITLRALRLLSRAQP